MKRKRNLADYVPPGIDGEQERNRFLIGIIAANGFCLPFLTKYMDGLKLLYWSQTDKIVNWDVLREGTVMTDFCDIAGPWYVGFLIVIAAAIAVAYHHYQSFFQGSKSMYLMKRLPDRRELARRVAALPLGAAAAALVAAGILLMVMFGVYMIVTPDSCITPGQWQKLWGWKIMIKIENLSKKYREKQALDQVSLTLGPGEIVGLFGENGAGKTTLMKSIFGFIPYQGSITLDGEPITHKNITRLSFATSEHSFFPRLSAEGHGQFYREHFSSFSEKRFRGLMDFFQLPFNKPIQSFSMGQKNQFEVVMALCQGADYILMDEPFAGNDVFNREDFYKVLLGILEPNETVLLSTHLIEEVAGFIGRAVLINEGRLVGDVSVPDLEESGKSLMSYIKETYHYRSDRVMTALEAMTEEGQL